MMRETGVLNSHFNFPQGEDELLLDTQTANNTAVRDGEQISPNTMVSVVVK